MYQSSLHHDSLLSNLMLESNGSVHDGRPYKIEGSEDAVDAVDRWIYLM